MSTPGSFLKSSTSSVSQLSALSSGPLNASISIFPAASSSTQSSAQPTNSANFKTTKRRLASSKKQTWQKHSLDSAAHHAIPMSTFFRTASVIETEQITNFSSSSETEAQQTTNLLSLSETDEQLTIVNRSMPYHISKKLLLKVPLFEVLMSHGALQETADMLDFDQKAFEIFLSYLKYDYIIIKIDFVVNLCTIAYILGYDDNLIDDCTAHFKDNFSIENLHLIIPQVTLNSCCINSSVLDAFICRYFTKIVASAAWSTYPIETIEYILKLDLKIYSEQEVFQALIKWLRDKTDETKSRSCRIGALLKLVRWCNLETTISELLRKNVTLTDELRSACAHNETVCNCNIDRTKQFYYIAIERSTDKELQVKVFDENFLLLINKALQLDETRQTHFIHSELVSDVFFDSGRKIVQINWLTERYRLLDISSYIRTLEFFSEGRQGEPYTVQMLKKTCSNAGSLFETNEKFITVAMDGTKLRFWSPSTGHVNYNLGESGHRYHATVLKNSIYILLNNFEFLQFTIASELVPEKVKITKLNIRNLRT